MVSYFPVFIQVNHWGHYEEERLYIPIESVRLEGGKLVLEGSGGNDTGTQWQVRDEIDCEGNLISVRREWTYLGERLGGVRLGFDLLCEFSDKEFMDTGNGDLLARAKSVVDSYVDHSGLPNGLYLMHYDIVKGEFVNEPCTTLQMAEGVYWLLRANALLSDIEGENGAWSEFARRFCDFLVGHQLPSGSFGEKWSPSGELVADHRCGGVYGVATLAEAFKAFGESRYLESAERGARYYIDSCVDEESNYGICTDLSDTAIEMDGNDAVVFALLEIYELTKKPVYLDKAIKAAEFGLSFQYVYNIAFSPHSDAGRHDLDTRGGAVISNEIPFIGYWVAWAALGFLRLWEHTGDQRWRERAVSAIKHTTHLMTTEEDTFGCASHLIGCRDEVLGVVDVAKGGVFRRKGMAEIAQFEPVFWPAAFNLLNMVVIKEKYPALIEEFG